MPKTKWDGAVEPQLTFYKIDKGHFEYALKSADRPKQTAAFNINRSRQK